MTGGAAAPAVAGAVKAGAVIAAAAEVAAGAAVGAAVGAGVGAGAGAVVGAAEAAAEANRRRKQEEAAERWRRWKEEQRKKKREEEEAEQRRRWEEEQRRIIAAREKKKREEEEEKARRRWEEEQRRRIIAAMEKKKREEEEKARRRREEEEMVSRQPFMFFCLLRYNNKDKATRSHSGQNNEETQGTGTQTHHGSTGKQQSKTEAAAGGCAPGGGDPPGGGGDRHDREDGGSSSSSSDSDSEAKVLMLNPRSLANKVLEIMELISEKDLHIICFMETFLGKKNDRKILNLIADKIYRYFYKNRENCKRLSGGVATMFKKLKGKQRKFKSLKMTTFEFVGAQLKKDKWIRPIVVICLYRKPGQTISMVTDFVQELEKLLQKAKKISKSVIIMGDFNIWVDRTDMKVVKEVFQPFLDKNRLQQHVKEPTYPSGHILDLVLTTGVQVRDLSVGGKLISDHYPVYCKIRPDQLTEEEQEEVVKEEQEEVVEEEGEEEGENKGTQQKKM